MEGRRQRIKAVVNLQPKRKIDAARNQSQSKPISASISSASSSSTSPTTNGSSLTKVQVSSNLEHETTNENVSSQPQNNLDHPQSTSTTQNIIEVDHTDEIKLENSPFKRPPDVKNISSETLSSSTTFISSVPLEIQLEQQQQQQQQQNLINPTSSSSSSQQALKPRQRIKPTPFFGVSRRSSIQGNSAQDIEEENHCRRQRNLSEQGGNQTSVGSNSSIDKSQTNETCPLDLNVTETGNNNATNIPGTPTVGGANSNRNQITPSRYRKTSSSEDAFQKSSFSVSAVNKRSSIKYNNSKPIEKSAMKMLDFIYYNPSTNPMNLESDKTEQIQTESIVGETSGDKPTEKENQSQPNTAVAETPASSAPAVPVPQLKLGPNGEVILDEQSLVIETTAEKEGRKNLLKSGILYLDDNTGNNGFYKRHKRTREWPSEETIKFYRCLHTVGTDFSLMLTLFPNRTRRDLKLKFKKEEKVNLGLVNKALLYPKTFNLDELRKELEVDEVVEKNKKLKEVQTKSFVKRAKKTYKTKSKLSVQSSASRIISDGELSYDTHLLLNKKDGVNVNDPISAEKLNVNVKRQQHQEEEEKEKESNERERECNDGSGDVDEQFFFDMLLKEEQDNNANSSDTINQKKIMLKKASDISIDYIDEILISLSNGSLVLVSSEDSNNPGETINEIYIMCKQTGKLSDRPLDLPEDVINCIISSESDI